MKIREIAESVGGEIVGSGEVEITGIAAIGTAGVGDIAFFTGSSFDSDTNASCTLIGIETANPKGLNVIRVSDPKLAFAKAAKLLTPYTVKYTGGWSVENPTSIIAESADVRTVNVGKFVTVGEDSYIGEGCEIGDGARIGNGVSIGKFSIIHQNCVISDNVEIGDECTIHAGTVIGADGFGYVRDENGEHIKFPQVGTVVIEDNVEIGANSCIDRGSLGETRIGEGTKIDNLVQIAHNVQIGKRCIVAALTGISGSTVLEDDVVLAGQVGIADHVTLKQGTVIGAKSAVFPNKIVHSGVWCGVPVQRIDDYKRQHAILKGVERLKDRVDEIVRRLDLANRDS